MMRRFLIFFAFGITLLSLSCSGRGSQGGVDSLSSDSTGLVPSGNVNAVYYWKTTFSLDTVEQRFLQQHRISKLYCRYFDVVMTDEDIPMPNATIRFQQSVPDTLEVVPTVFIMNDCMQAHHDSLAQRIVKRIVQMNATNDVSCVREIQIDCDYTARNRQLYYEFLEEARNEARVHGLSLSATIRLHQLSMPAPPVDDGVLMLYNTGDPNRLFDTKDSRESRESLRNPILDLRDVKPYLHHLKDYPLPLAAAYPVFRWQRTVHGVDILHVADYEEISRVKRLVEAEREDVRRLIITYHLDNENINRYTSEQYENIYCH